MHQTMQGTLHPVFNSRQLLLASTAKPITPFGGLVSLIEFFDVLKLGEVLGRLMPFTYTSPNAIAPEQTLLAFVISIIAGARQLAHTDWLRADRALHAMLGMERFPGTDTVRNLLKRFTQPMIEAFWRPLWQWLLLQGWAGRRKVGAWTSTARCSSAAGIKKALSVATTHRVRGDIRIIRCSPCWRRHR